MINFPISPEKQKALKERMQRIGLYESDVVEKFTRSGGRGGQNVNKVETAVYLKHLPTGLEVKMQRERAQALNRFFAWRLLAEKLEEKLFKEKSEKTRLIEKIRRQKRKRSRRSKEKMLRDKKITGEKKQSRAFFNRNRKTEF